MFIEINLINVVRYINESFFRMFIFYFHDHTLFFYNLMMMMIDSLLDVSPT